jgi:hypothetical protein
MYHSVMERTFFGSWACRNSSPSVHVSVRYDSEGITKPRLDMKAQRDNVLRLRNTRSWLID